MRKAGDRSNYETQDKSALVREKIAKSNTVPPSYFLLRIMACQRRGITGCHVSHLTTGPSYGFNRIMYLRGNLLSQLENGQDTYIYNYIAILYR